MRKIDKKNIRDILALTPMQEGMLFHYLKDPVNNHYFGQLILEISGEINLEHFKKAWDFLIETNEMLRTVFRWEKVAYPLQIILKEHKLQPKYYDFLDADGDVSEKKKRLEEIQENDREKRFDLCDVPFRVILCQIEKNKYEMIISNHHILYDGWSNGIILKVFVQAYESLRKSGKVMAVPVRPYRDYINWLNRQDKQEGLRYWEEYLDGYDRQATLPTSGNLEIIKREYKKEEYHFFIEELLSEGLREVAINTQVSINTIFQTIWGILLHRYNNTDDVVFGVVVSGRSSEIKDVNRMVGLFINTIPVRVKIGNKYSFLELLKEVQENMILSTHYEYVPLADIQGHSLVKENLIDHILSFQNYPVKKEDFSPGEEAGFNIKSVKSIEQTNYNFNFVLFPEKRFHGKLMFNSLKYPLDSIKTFVLHFNEVLRQVVMNPSIDIRKIEIMRRIEKEKPMGTFKRRSEGKTKAQYVENKIEKRTDPGKIEADFDF